MLLVLGDSVTTNHISPAGAIKQDSPAGRYLSDHGVALGDFTSYGSRRGNHEVMIAALALFADIGRIDSAGTSTYVRRPS